MSLLESYQRAITSGQFSADKNQAKVVNALQTLYHALSQEKTRNFFSFGKKNSHPKGLYLWGNVGVGKTWLMDLFFESAPLQQKRRVHFHAFMQEIHYHLQQMQGQSSPLRLIAKKYAQQIKLLCFDEFLVTDIGDAMLLGNLLEALFNEKMVVVATSNAAPDNLYKNGLQRERFLSAITLIKKHMEVIHLADVPDYRLRNLEAAGLFFYPADTTKLKQLFLQLAQGNITYQTPLILDDRRVQTIAYADNIIWFDFNILCTVPRNHRDYLVIAQQWRYLIIDNLEQIAAKDTNTARCFINLIDILYDKKIILLLNSAVSLDKLYPQGELQFEFQRTQSRLVEMQSHDYLAKAAKRMT